ncbi:MAG: hypothetical protein K1X47_15865 [Cyclobacteriaceae bacterium]|nr:hypothetical protein [Cyclobacteriaceae bacterium]
MRIATIALIWSLLVSSCSEITFPVAQPAGEKALTELPPTLTGRYLAHDQDGEDTDTLIIEPSGYHFMDKNGKDFLNRGVISDTLVIKYYQGYYFVNFRSENQWVLRIVRQKPSGSIEFLGIDIQDEEVRKAVLKRLKKDFRISSTRKKDISYYMINPSPQQLMQLLKGGFFTGGELDKVR